MLTHQQKQQVKDLSNQLQREANIHKRNKYGASTEPSSPVWPILLILGAIGFIIGLISILA